MEMKTLGPEFVYSIKINKIVTIALAIFACTFLVIVRFSILPTVSAATEVPKDTCGCYQHPKDSDSLKSKISYEFQRSPSVFSGEVAEIKPVATGPFTGFVEVTFAIKKSWKNAPGSTIKILTEATLDGSPGADRNCGFTFSKGECYLVYVESTVGSDLLTSVCTRTRKLADAFGDVMILEKLH